MSPANTGRRARRPALTETTWIKRDVNYGAFQAAKTNGGAFSSTSRPWWRRLFGGAA